MKQYEAMIILNEKLKDEEEIDKALDGLKAEVKALGGKAITASKMGRKAFARMMDKSVAGEYGLMRFQLAADQVDVLRKKLKFNEDLFRMQVVVLENKKPAAPAAEKASAATK